MVALIRPESNLILPSTRRMVDFGVSTHRLDDSRVVLALPDQLATEYGETWYAVATFSNGRAFCFGRTESARAPSADMLDKMLACAMGLNRSIDHGGCWIVVWHAQRLSFMWRDPDGDAAFITQVDEPWHRIRMWAADAFCERAEAAWRQWHEMISDVFERRPEETIKRALGQPSASTAVH